MTPPPAPADWRARAQWVRAIRWALPLAAATLGLALILWADRPDAPAPPAEPAPKPAQAYPQLPDPAQWDNMLVAPRFESRDKDGRPYTITANRALQDTGTDAPILLEQPAARWTAEDGSRMALHAALGRYDPVGQALALTGGVEIASDVYGDRLETDALSVDLAASRATSTAPVQAMGPGRTLTAAGLVAEAEPASIVFTGPGRATMAPEEPGAAPTTLTAQESLAYHKDAQTFVAKGAARAERGGHVLTAPVIEALTRTKEGGGLELVRADARGGVAVQMPDGARATSETAWYDAAARRVEAVGGVRITQPDGAWVSAPHMAGDLVEDSSGGGGLVLREVEAWGGVVAVQGDNRIEGPRARIDMETGRATMLSGAQRARAVIYPGEDGEVTEPF